MYFNKNHYPRHFILIGSDPLFHETEAESIVQEAVKLYPDEFSGECKSFEHTIRYVAPYERNFDEIKRLQGIAAFHAGRRSDFHGYLILDISEYLRHESEFYFEALLAFLYDQNDVWKYIFSIRSERINQKSVAMLVRKLLSIPQCSVLEQNLSNQYYDRLFVRQCCLDNDLECIQAAENVFVDVLSSGVSRDAVAFALDEIAGLYGTKRKVGCKLLKQYFEIPSLSLLYMLSPAQHENILMALRTNFKKEREHEEKS